MKLSIVIVNYNVKYFLEQCLRSVDIALKGIDGEVFMVDNASSDQSVEMVQEKFPHVKVIANKDNVGFSVANNQAMCISKGEYILLLNPDTVVEENTFRESIKFMDEHPDAGALGVKMIDGKGNFLPESKRGLPTPWVSFYKIFGLSSLFPKSPKYARYHMGHLDKDENHEIEILAGAYMFMRKEALDKCGLLDEDFFMYGEDIDLSYRILKAGYKNYYLADTSIIHYKGESTKKGSLNYVYVFYKAMAIFAKKHFSGTYASMFNFMITLAIYLRAGISVFKRIVSALSLPVLDAGVFLAGLYYIKEYWEHNHRFIVGGEYPQELVWTAFPLYALAWITGIFISGGYEKPTRIVNLIKGVVIGSVAILVGYSLVSEEYRFSRAIILLGSVWAMFATPLLRVLIQRIFKTPLISITQENKRILIVGTPSEAARVEQLIKQTSGRLAYLAFVSPNDSTFENNRYIGHLTDLADISRIFQIDEVIFCSKDISGNDIFKKMAELNPLKVEIKIAPTESEFVIGSNSIDSQGSWYTIQFNDISKPANRRAKRIFDIATAFILLLISPVIVWAVEQKAAFFRNIFAVLSGRKTWVGYDSQVSIDHLPKLKNAILKTTLNSGLQSGNDVAINHINQLYAKNYKVWNDLQFIISGYKYLGN